MIAFKAPYRTQLLGTTLWTFVLKFNKSLFLGGEDPAKMFGKSDPLWTFENLKAYFGCCRQICPAMGKDASQVLSKYYQGTVLILTQFTVCPIHRKAYLLCTQLLMSSNFFSPSFIYSLKVS